MSLDAIFRNGNGRIDFAEFCSVIRKTEDASSINWAQLYSKVRLPPQLKEGILSTLATPTASLLPKSYAHRLGASQPKC
jgi:hypothetical protein